MILLDNSLYIQFAANERWARGYTAAESIEALACLTITCLLNTFVSTSRCLMHSHLHYSHLYHCLFWQNVILSFGPLVRMRHFETTDQGAKL
uniref:Uncharacterized protein n=1 Tax=Arundo donax TaxID=35708 RepID=A0A0A9DS46_ARUDO